jgi:hypothetical protein
MKKQMTPLERCPLLGHPWQQAACPCWFLCSRCGAVRAPAPSPDGPSPQRGGHV